MGGSAPVVLLLDEPPSSPVSAAMANATSTTIGRVIAVAISAALLYSGFRGGPPGR
jgi:hypothetical protein